MTGKGHFPPFIKCERFGLTYLPRKPLLLLNSQIV
jgi:hypothetical protein